MSEQNQTPLWQQTAEQQIEQAREIAEIRSDVQHMNTLLTQIDSKLQLLFTLSKDVATIDQRISDLGDGIRRAHERINVVEAKADDTKQTTSAWINRGLGAWVIGGILFGVIQALVLDRVKTYETSQSSNTQRLDSLDKRILWIEYAAKLPANQDKETK